MFTEENNAEGMRRSAIKWFPSFGRFAGIISGGKGILAVLLVSICLLRADSWQSELETMLSSFLSCQSEGDDQSPCNVFLARALKLVYGVTDFDKPGSNPPYMTANEIATYVAMDDKWTFLGLASDQSALDSAAGYAKLKKAIIAVEIGAPHGHVALILPGNLTHSASWNLNVPNSASFFLGHPTNSYVGKPLSFAFKAADLPNVKIYGRNF